MLVQGRLSRRRRPARRDALRDRRLVGRAAHRGGSRVRSTFVPTLEVPLDDGRRCSASTARRARSPTGSSRPPPTMTSRRSSPGRGDRAPRRPHAPPDAAALRPVDDRQPGQRRPALLPVVAAATIRVGPWAEYGVIDSDGRGSTSSCAACRTTSTRCSASASRAACHTRSGGSTPGIPPRGRRLFACSAHIVAHSTYRSLDAELDLRGIPANAKSPSSPTFMATGTRSRPYSRTSTREAGRDWCLGDLVGYGPQPNRCTPKRHALRRSACRQPRSRCDRAPRARASSRRTPRPLRRWTQAVLEHEPRASFALEPKGASAASSMFHGSPHDPVWEYVLSEGSARRAFEPESVDSCSSATATCRSPFSSGRHARRRAR